MLLRAHELLMYYIGVLKCLTWCLTSLYIVFRSMLCLGGMKYAVGKPGAVQDDQKHLLPTTSSSSISYPQLYLRDVEITIRKDNQKTLRNNSCLVYKSGESECYGIMQNLIVHNENAFAVVIPLKICDGVRLCKDDITKANIDSHIICCSQPRYKNMLICANLRLHVSPPPPLFAENKTCV